MFFNVFLQIPGNTNTVKFTIFTISLTGFDEAVLQQVGKSSTKRLLIPSKETLKIPSLKLTHTIQTGRHAKGEDHLPSINFQKQVVSFREG